MQVESVLRNVYHVGRRGSKVVAIPNSSPTTAVKVATDASIFIVDEETETVVVYPRSAGIILARVLAVVVSFANNLEIAALECNVDDFIAEQLIETLQRGVS